MVTKSMKAQSNDSEATESTRRSGRTRSQPSSSLSSAPDFNTPQSSRGLKKAGVASKVGPKSKETVVSSDEDEALVSNTDEPNRKATAKQKSRTKQATAKVESASKKAVPARKKAPPSSKNVMTTKKVASEPETEAEEEAEDEEPVSAQDDEDESESESSSEEDDGGSDFEDRPKKKPVTKKAATPRTPKPKKDKVARIPLIKRSAATRTPKSPKQPKTAKPSKPSKLSKPSTSDPALESTSGDSELYDAVLESISATDAALAAWMEKYNETPQAALLDFINFLIKSCGCSQLVTLDEFEDSDNIVETLEDVLARFKENTTNFDYPIISRAKEFKRFKKNLTDLCSRLVEKSRGDILFDDVFMDTILSWTISLSSTTFRPVRHTATVVAMNLATSLTALAAQAQEDVNIANRQLSTSQKKKAPVATIKQLSNKLKESQEQKTVLQEWVDQLSDSVFVMRYRDVDPLIRADCVRELGAWMVVYPDHFIVSSYLRYLGWILSDRAPSVRLDALKSLIKLYEMDNLANSLRHFTTRFSPRLVEMAISESDANVRLGAIRLITLIHKHGLLEDDDKAKLCGLIFGTNPKVRKALGKFVKTVIWEDDVNRNMAACEVLSQAAGADPVREDWVTLKAIANFFITHGQDEGKDNLSLVNVRMIGEAKTGRVALAVEALWGDIGVLKEWKSIAEYIVKDHSSTTPDTQSTGSQRPNAPKTIEEFYRLTDEEETVLLEVFITSLRMTLKPPSVPGFQKDKSKQESQLAEVAIDVGRQAVELLPKFFLKYGVDPNRVQFILTIPQLFPLSVYVDMRMIRAYEDLVDEVVKVYKKYSDASVLYNAAETLRAMRSCQALSAAHDAKINELCTSVLESFSDQCSTITEIADLDQDEFVSGLGPVLSRLEYLIKNMDLTAYFARSDARKGHFANLLSVIKIGKDLGKDKAEIVVSAIAITFFLVSWQCQRNTTERPGDIDWTLLASEDMKQKQEAFMTILRHIAFAVDDSIAISIKRRAFRTLGDMYWLFGSDMFHRSKGPNRVALRMTCPETEQAELEVFVRKETLLWSEQLAAASKSAAEASAMRQRQATIKAKSDGHVDNDEEMEGIPTDTSDEPGCIEPANVEQAEKYEMFGTVFSYMRQLILKDVSMKHAPALIAHYGRFGTEYDEGIKQLMARLKLQTADVRDIHARQLATEVFMEVCLDSLKQSFDLYLEDPTIPLTQSMSLAKLVSNTIKPPGFLQIVRAGIPNRYIWALLQQGISYALDKVAALDEQTQILARNKVLQFFDLLGHLLFGMTAPAQEIERVQDHINSEMERIGLEVLDRDDTWEPLRSFKGKLEKLAAKGKGKSAQEATDSATAAAAALPKGVEPRSENVVGVEADVEMAESDDAAAPIVVVESNTVIEEEEEAVTASFNTLPSQKSGAGNSLKRPAREEVTEVEGDELESDDEPLVRNRYRVNSNSINTGTNKRNITRRTSEEVEDAMQSDRESESSFMTLTATKPAKRSRNE